MTSGFEPSTDTIRRAAAACDRLTAALYDGAIEKVDGGLLMVNRWIDEPEWNHVGGVDVAPGELDAALALFADRLRERRRCPAVVVDLLSRPADLEERLPELGWRESFRHAGLIFPAGRAAVAAEWPRAATLEEFSSASDVSSRPAHQVVEAFARIFDEAFRETAGGALSPAYGRAFASALERPATGVEVVHTLVRIDGEPAAIGSRVTADGVSGLYNLGVTPGFRRLGLGGAITRHRVAEARRAGADVVYLLTEDPRVEASQLRRGFVRGFERVGLVVEPAV